MGRSIFLDDDQRRIDKFRSWLPSAEIAMTAPDMISKLKSGPAKIVFLDHDLRGVKYDDSSRDDCGMEVVRWIVTNKPEIKSIVLHTCNMKASPVMKDQLTSAGYTVHQIPFPYLFERLKIKQGVRRNG